MKFEFTRPWATGKVGIREELVMETIGFYDDCFKYFLFSPLLGEMIQFDEHIFQMGWFNHQLGFYDDCCLCMFVSSLQMQTECICILDYFQHFNK